MGYEKRIKRRRVKLTDIPPSHKEGKSFDIEVEAEELCLIAERLKLPALQSLRVKGSVKQLPDVPIYRLEGSATGDMVLLCTVSLEEFTDRFDESLQWEFSRDRHYKPQANNMESPNYPEYIEEDAIDAVEYAVQTLGLNLPAYPRRPGADLSDWQKNNATAEMIRKGWLVFGANNAAAAPDKDLNAVSHKADNVGASHNTPFAALAELKRKFKS